MRVRKALAAVAMSAGLMAGGIASGAGTARAADGCDAIGGHASDRPWIGWNGCVAATDGLWSRFYDGRPQVAWSDELFTAFPYNTGLSISCWLSGPAVQGPWGTSTVWDKVELYEWPGAGASGFTFRTLAVPDAWVYTGSNDPVVPHC
ncbi:hypothetical protein [Kitasatospora sp. NPDC001527]|uniref:hypothetical protein n=1 Tax=Kitasatospora sp. NPDC001527 TaxID=3154519 RepID=UPI00333253DC